MTYRHIQTGYTFLITLLWMAIMAGILIASGLESSALVSLTALLVAIEVIIVIFNRLTVVVGDGELLTAFGFG